MARLNDGIYPARKYRRAWVVSSGGNLQRYNGAWTFYGHSSACTGEVLLRPQGCSVAVKRQLLKYWPVVKRDVSILPILIPRIEGRSEHVRAMLAYDKSTIAAH